MGKERTVRIMTVEEAEAYVRKDCPYCVRNYEYAKEKGWRVIVDTDNKDVIGVEVGGED